VIKVLKGLLVHKVYRVNKESKVLKGSRDLKVQKG
jgi:hypothetical protein